MSQTFKLQGQNFEWPLRSKLSWAFIVYLFHAHAKGWLPEALPDIDTKYIWCHDQSHSAVTNSSKFLSIDLNLKCDIA